MNLLFIVLMAVLWGVLGVAYEDFFKSIDVAFSMMFGFFYGAVSMSISLYIK